MMELLDQLLRIVGGGALLVTAGGFALRLVTKTWADITVENKKGALAKELEATKAEFALFAEKQKAELQQNLERVKTDLGFETEKLKSELGKDAEVHKLRLKKQEIIFSKQIEATSAFFQLRERYDPKKDMPDKEWDDVREDLLHSLTDIAAKTREYRTKFGPVLSDEVMALINSIISSAEEHQFAAHGIDNYTREDTEKALDGVHEAFQTTAKQLVTEMRP